MLKRPSEASGLTEPSKASLAESSQGGVNCLTKPPPDAAIIIWTWPMDAEVPTRARVFVPEALETATPVTYIAKPAPGAAMRDTLAEVEAMTQRGPLEAEGTAVLV